MGRINSITCKNCGYHKELYEGAGMISFARCKQLEQDILDGSVVNPEALKLLKKGHGINIRAAYLCPACKEFVNDNTMYMRDNVTISPYGSVRYEVKYPFGKPVCKVCGSELEYIKNIRSSNVKCPKCNGDLKSRVAGYVD